MPLHPRRDHSDHSCHRYHPSCRHGANSTRLQSIQDLFGSCLCRMEMFFWKKSRGGRVALNVRLENNISCALSACQLYHTSPVWAVIIISPVVFVRRMASRPLGVLIATTIPSASIISIKTIATGSSSASFYFFRRVIPPQNMSRKCRKIGSKIRRATRCVATRLQLLTNRQSSVLFLCALYYDLLSRLRVVSARSV